MAAQDHLQSNGNTGPQSFDNSAIDALPPLKRLLPLDMRARKSLGQNFLFDLNLTRRIASAGRFDGTTIEVGPGPAA